MRHLHQNMSNEADDIRAAAGRLYRDIERTAKQAQRELRRSAQQAAKEGRWQAALEQSQAVQSELKKAAEAMRDEFKTARDQQAKSKPKRTKVGREQGVTAAPTPTAAPATPQAEPAPRTMPLPLTTLPPMTAKARQGLGVYALNELAEFEQALSGLGIHAQGEQVSLVWQEDVENSAGRAGFKARPVADIGGRLFTLQRAQAESSVQTLKGMSGTRLATNAETEMLARGEWVAITPAMWSQVRQWRGFSGGALQILEGLESSKSGLSLAWVAVLVFAFVTNWWVGLLWLLGTGWLAYLKPVRPYRAAYFEDAAPPSALREWLWHTLGQDSTVSDSLLPDILHISTPPGRPEPARPASQAAHEDMLEHLPADLAAGLRMVRERVADLPEEDIATPEGYRLRQLDNHCEDAAALYLQLPADSPAKAEAEAEVRAMLEDVLEDLAGAGSRSEQQQEQTLRAIRDLRARSTRTRNPLKLD